MGNYIPGLKGDKPDGDPSKRRKMPQHTEGRKKSKYKVVYTSRDVKVCELPKDMRALIVMRRSR